MPRVNTARQGECSRHTTVPTPHLLEESPRLPRKNSTNSHETLLEALPRRSLTTVAGTSVKCGVCMTLKVQLTFSNVCCDWSIPNLDNKNNRRRPNDQP